MKRIFLILLFLAGVAAEAQTYQYNATPYEFNLMRVRTQQRLPKDTIASADSGSISFKNGLPWIKAGTWKNIVIQPGLNDSMAAVRASINAAIAGNGLQSVLDASNVLTKNSEIYSGNNSFGIFRTNYDDYFMMGGVLGETKYFDLMSQSYQNPTNNISQLVIRSHLTDVNYNNFVFYSKFGANINNVQITPTTFKWNNDTVATRAYARTITPAITNIYNSDGTLTGNRVVRGNNLSHYLAFDSLSSFIVSNSPTTIINSVSNGINNYTNTYQNNIYEGVNDLYSYGAGGDAQVGLRYHPADTAWRVRLYAARTGGSGNAPQHTLEISKDSIVISKMNGGSINGYPNVDFRLRRLPFKASLEASDSLAAVDALGKFYKVSKDNLGLSGSGSTPTLQQVFNTETGGSILSKSDTIITNGNSLYMKKNTYGYPLVLQNSLGGGLRIDGSTTTGLEVNTTTGTPAVFYSNGRNDSARRHIMLSLQHVPSTAAAQSGIGSSIVFTNKRPDGSGYASQEELVFKYTNDGSGVKTQVDIGTGNPDDPNGALMSIRPEAVRVNYGADTLATKAYARSLASSGGGGSTPTLQQVLTAGSTLSGTNTINTGTGVFGITRNNTSLTFNTNAGIPSDYIETYTSNGERYAGSDVGSAPTENFTSAGLYAGTNTNLSDIRAYSNGTVSIDANVFKLIGLSGATEANVLYYNPTTKVVTHGAAPGGGAAVQKNFLIEKFYKKLGSTIKGEPWFTLGEGQSNNINLTNQELKLVAVNLDSAATLTGVKFGLMTGATFTGNNFNGFGLYTYDGAGVLTLVAQTANNETFFKGSRAFKAAPFTSTYAAQPGLYYVAALFSAPTGSPTLMGKSDVMNEINAADFTNSAKLAGYISSQASLPASINFTSVVNNSAAPYMAVY